MSTAPKRGRTSSKFNTNHFTRGREVGNSSNRYYWDCNYCSDAPDSTGREIEGRDNKLLSHIADSRKCPAAPSHARAEAARELAAKKPLVEQPDAATSTEMVIDVDVITVTGDGTGAAEKPKKKRKVTGTLDHYVDNALTQTQKNNADRKWLRFIVHANVAFRASDNEFLADFFSEIRPSYSAPSRYVL
ncbi:hypothetical protein FB45DRAFT_766221, partial [Roridomyces roridus]